MKRAVRYALFSVALFVVTSSVAQSAGLVFDENIGQFDPEVRFQARAGDLTVFAASDHVWLSWQVDETGVNRGFSSVRTANLRLSFAGCDSAPSVEGMESVPTRMSYFVGADQSDWQATVPVWRKVRYRAFCQQTDLFVDGQGGRLQLRLVVDRQQDLRALQPVLEGADDLTNDGEVLILPGGAGRAIVTGHTRSFDFPATPGSFGATCGGGTCLAGQSSTGPVVAELELPWVFFDGFECGGTAAWDWQSSTNARCDGFDRKDRRRIRGVIHFR